MLAETDNIEVVTATKTYTGAEVRAFGKQAALGADHQRYHPDIPQRVKRAAMSIFTFITCRDATPAR